MFNIYHDSVHFGNFFSLVELTKRSFLYEEPWIFKNSSINRSSQTCIQQSLYSSFVAEKINKRTESIIYFRFPVGLNFIKNRIENYHDYSGPNSYRKWIQLL